MRRNLRIQVILFASLVILLGNAAAEMNEISFDNANEWGAFRPNVYVGMRAKAHRSPLFGVMWYNLAQNNPYDHIRHDCDERDEFSRFGWYEHNARDYGMQYLEDKRLRLNLTTRFVASAADSWNLRIEGQALSKKKDKREQRIGLLYYWALDHPEHSISLSQSQHSSKTTEDNFRAEFDFGELGNFYFYADEDVNCPDSRDRDCNAHGLDQTYFQGFSIDDIQIGNPDYPDEIAAGQNNVFPFWDVKTIARHVLIQKHQNGKFEKEEKQRNAKLDDERTRSIIYSKFSNRASSNSRIIIFQKFVKTPFQIDFAMVPKPILSWRSSKEIFSKQMLDRSIQFHSKFHSTFDLPEDDLQDPAMLSMAKFSLSNLVGGVGFFDGRWLRYDLRKSKIMKPTSLFSAVPSRSFFPRGFLWDEGFHLQVIGQWDLNLALEIIVSWSNVMESDGWIPREQILGSESRSRVPREFHEQNPIVANPPTLILAAEKFITAFLNGKSDIFLEDESSENSVEFGNLGATKTDEILVYTKLKSHALWYFRTLGDVHQTRFRWVDRSRSHCLSSGLDDFPRAFDIRDDEAHIDLQSWMIALSKSMAALAHKFGKIDDASFFEEKQKELRLYMIDNFWDEKEQCFFDLTSNSERNEREFVKHIGYVCFYPLMLGLLDPDSAQLNALVRKLRDPEKVWSDFGIRSLSKTDPLFGSGEDYWRGHIWINMNYLLLKGLRYYGWKVESPFKAILQETYIELRKNVLTNVHREWKRTGTVWEQYNGLDGKGQRSSPFTGWTSLILLILAHEY